MPFAKNKLKYEISTVDERNLYRDGVGSARSTLKMGSMNFASSLVEQFDFGGAAELTFHVTTTSSRRFCWGEKLGYTDAKSRTVE